MAGGGLAHFGEAENCNRIIEKVEEGDVSCLDCLEEFLCFFCVVHCT